MKAMRLSTMETYHPTAPLINDYEDIHINGGWYQSWQGGYCDIIKRGYPKPADERTILAELYGPFVPDVLHGGCGNVPFLVSERARDIFELNGVSGIEFANVEIAKIATKGLRSRKQRRGEPEDAILKSSGIQVANKPVLFAVYVIGRVDVVLDYESGRAPSGSISPFTPINEVNHPDMWCPRANEKRYSAWAFCSARFKRICEENNLSNIEFRSFNTFMAKFRGISSAQLG